MNIRVGAASAPTWNDPLAAAALVHSKDMAKNDQPRPLRQNHGCDSAEMGAAYATETRSAMGIHWTQVFGCQRKR